MSGNVSVIIPNYNRRQIIGETIDNMLRQSLPPHEIIVVDDGSTDDSVKEILKFGDKVQLIQQSNQGPGAARNAGLKVASGEFVQFMDSDDLASLNKLAVQSKVATDNNADIVYGPWAKVWLQGRNVRMQDVVLQQQPLPPKRSPLLWFLTSWSIIFQQCLVRRSLLDKVGGYREDMRLYEDGELFIRLLLAEAKLVHEDSTLTLYRLGDHGKLTGSGSGNRQKIIDRARFFILVAKLINQYSESKHFIDHPEFQLAVWNTYVELSNLTPVPSQMLSDLSYIAKHPTTSFKMLIKDWSSKKYKGIQNRLIGHRWPSCYLAENITTIQQHLIHEIGYQYEIS